MNIISFFKKNKTPFFTRGGVNVPHKKNTDSLKCVVITPPETVVIPMAQHIGAPCLPFVSVGEHVKLGQLIANRDNSLFAPIHASVSGTVSKIDKLLMPNGNSVDAIFINSDGKMEKHESVVPHIVNSPESLVSAAKSCGLVGLGGAGFPTHVKLNIPKDKTCDTLIINIAECEPYITSDSRAVIENSKEIIDGIKIILNTLKIKKAVIGIEDNKHEAIKKLSSALQPKNDNISILVLKSKYPQGAEKVLIKATTGKEVPVGGLPIDAGCIVMNVSTVLCLYNYISTGMPLVSKRITVDGSAVSEPKNLIVPIGTPIRDVIKFCGGYKNKPQKILMGGPMMGTAVINDELPILKQNNAIIAFAEKNVGVTTPSACIRCGRCVKNCPMSLMPALFEKNVENKNIDELNKLSIMNCIECGCCSFNCPSSRPLVQSIKLGKNFVKVKR